MSESGAKELRLNGLDVLYVSTLCSQNVFKQIFDNATEKPQQQAQKFHFLLSKGLAQVVRSLCVLSRPPLNRSASLKLPSMMSGERVGGIDFHYASVLGNPVFRHLYLFFGSLIFALRWAVKHRRGRRVIICDALNLSISLGALLGAKLCGIKAVAIVTDLPDFLKISDKKSSPDVEFIVALYRRISNFFLKRYDYYLVLTEHINKVVNPGAKPHLVIEGMVDEDMKGVENLLANKCREKVVIYAGALHRRFGVGTLLEAFSRLEGQDLQLWLYGSGDLEPEIRRRMMDDSRISYLGVVENEIVVGEQLKATLLVNPRPSAEEFCKYSFPSKNMEYMVSGTPMATTCLPGMPTEYRDYVYTLDDESVAGMAKSLSLILGKSREELHAKGVRAKDFVLTKKNNRRQAEALVTMLGR